MVGAFGLPAARQRWHEQRTGQQEQECHQAAASEYLHVLRLSGRDVGKAARGIVGLTQTLRIYAG